MSKNTYRILTFDGGGIRGIMSAVWLDHLQSKLKKPINEYFDLIAGTSTGAILAGGVASSFKTNEMIDLYEKRGKEIFPGMAARLWSRGSRIFSEGVSAPKYDGNGLNNVLSETFKEKKFGELNKSTVLITSYDTLGREAVVFKSNDERYRYLKLWEICRASASAPTYFPAHVMEVRGVKLPLIDGGIVANNPTACAIAEAMRINFIETQNKDNRNTTKFELKDFVVASFGTGEQIRPISIEEAKAWGASQWVLPLIDVLFDGSADSVDYISSNLISTGNYFRFQTRLNDAYDDMDNADTTNINALKRCAQQYIDSEVGRDKFSHLAKNLEESIKDKKS